jgi:hypothetical protein
MRPISVISLSLIWCAVLLAQAPARNLAQRPLAFERRGVGFLAHGQGYVASLVSGKAVIRLITPEKSEISLQFIGSRNVAATPGVELPGKVNYTSGATIQSNGSLASPRMRARLTPKLIRESTLSITATRVRWSSIWW